MLTPQNIGTGFQMMAPKVHHPNYEQIVKDGMCIFPYIMLYIMWMMSFNS